MLKSYSHLDVQHEKQKKLTHRFKMRCWCSSFPYNSKVIPLNSSVKPGYETCLVGYKNPEESYWQQCVVLYPLPNAQRKNSMVDFLKKYGEDNSEFHQNIGFCPLNHQDTICLHQSQRGLRKTPFPLLDHTIQWTSHVSISSIILGLVQFLK